MTVKELKEYLAHYDDKTIIYCRAFVAKGKTYVYRYGEIVDLIKDDGVLEFKLNEEKP
jgi:hypothetical protein